MVWLGNRGPNGRGNPAVLITVSAQVLREIADGSIDGEARTRIGFLGTHLFRLIHQPTSPVTSLYRTPREDFNQKFKQTALISTFACAELVSPANRGKAERSIYRSSSSLQGILSSQTASAS